MSRKLSVVLAACVVAVVAALAAVIVTPGREIGAQTQKKVFFGLVGEAFDPAGGGGGATRDRVDPPLIFIKQGTTLEFNNRSGGNHQIAIYKDATGGLTNLADVGYPAPNFANYVEPQDGSAKPANRVAGGLGPSPVGVSTEDRQAGAIDLNYTFTTPGQYLVICNFRPHLVNFGMAQFVIVEETIP